MIQVVTDYLDDAMSTADLDAFETHLAGCDACTVYVDQIRMTVRLIGATGDEVELLPANFDQLAAELANRAAQ